VKLVINSVPIIVEKENYNPKDIQFDIGIDSIDDLKKKNLKGNVLVNNSTTEWLVKFLHEIGANKVKKLKSITFRTKDVTSFEKVLTKQLKQIEAAGGLVVKGSKI